MAKRKQRITRPAPGETQSGPDKSARKPLLSIGIIFRNEMRCLERCLQSLRPLRDAVSCQLVMADTGSDDGSREIAEQYADVLFDFPWIDDFSAARNAVFARCDGDWTLCIDCDEWLTDVSELLAFLRDPNPAVMMAEVVQRNYKSADFKGVFFDFMTFRLFRMRDRPRYEGAIHERVTFPRPNVTTHSLKNTVFHHDGYVNMESDAGRARRERNLALLRKELQRNPDDLFRILQYAESGYDAPDFLETLQRGMELAGRKRRGWDACGPAIFSYAAQFAFARRLDGWRQWAQKAETLFPDAYHVRLDLNALRCLDACNRKAYAESVRAGERYLQALSGFRPDEQTAEERVTTFAFGTESYANSVRVALTQSLFALGRTRDALDMLRRMDMTRIQLGSLPVLLHTLADMRRTLEEDFSPYVTALWDATRNALTENESPEKREQAFVNAAREIISDSVRGETRRAASPDGLPDGTDGQRVYRPAFTLFLPLAGKCPPGDWAELLTLDDPVALSDALTRQDVSAMPAPVLLHALSRGAEFPVPGRPLTLEEIQTLCESLRTEPDALIPLALDAVKPGHAVTLPALVWTEHLLFTALSACDWTAGPRRYELFRAFAATERELLSRYYAPEVLEHPAVMPPRRRAGLECVRALEALDNGEFAVCVARLRDALQQDNRMAQVMGFMLETVSRMERKAHASPELLDMAGQLRGMLASCHPDSPEVRQLKESPLYQKLAWLIEE